MEVRVVDVVEVPGALKYRVFLLIGSVGFSKGSYPVEYGVLPSETRVL